MGVGAEESSSDNIKSHFVRGERSRKSAKPSYNTPRYMIGAFYFRNRKLIELLSLVR